MIHCFSSKKGRKLSGPVERTQELYGLTAENLESVNSCNTPGVCHQLSNGFELKHGMLSSDEGVKIKSTRVSSNLNLGNTPLLAYWPFSDIHLSNVEGVSFMCLTSISTHLDEWKSFMKFGIKKSHEMISYNLSCNCFIK